MHLFDFEGNSGHLFDFEEVNLFFFEGDSVHLFDFEGDAVHLSDLTSNFSPSSLLLSTSTFFSSSFSVNVTSSPVSAAST